MNAPVRKLQNVNLTHREQVLKAISDKHYALNSKIDHSKALAMRFRDDLNAFEQNMPEDTGSRLHWIQQQLNQKGV